jgi:hypothetical protein
MATLIMLVFRPFLILKVLLKPFKAWEAVVVSSCAIVSKSALDMDHISSLLTSLNHDFEWLLSGV